MKAILKPHEETRILEGHPWIFRNEVADIIGEIKGGGIVDVYSSRDEFIGRGYLNFASKILIRILTYNIDEVIDESFFERRITSAINMRKDIRGNNSCRLIFSEADYLPGLIVDKYGDYIVIEISTLGMDLWREVIVKVIRKLLNPLGIYERSDNASRKKEGLEPVLGFIGEEFDTNIVIVENGFKMNVDLANGQKTGYFLDQTENRANIKNYVVGKKVLDCFSHTGAFGIHASGYGARDVVSVEISHLAVEKIKENIALNGFNNIKVIEDDAFHYLDEAYNSGERFDVVILDPPAFTKAKDTIKQAYLGYQKINTLGLKMLNPGGYLITFSCSGNMTADLFLEMLKNASRKAKKQVQLIEYRMQTKDHPMLLANMDTLYLKCAVIRVCE